MKDKKIIIALVILVVLILAIICFSLFSDDVEEISNKQEREYLIVGDYLIWQKQGDDWTQVTEFNDSVLNQTYNVYGDDQMFSDVTIQKTDSQLYFFDQNYKQVTLDNYRAATSHFDISLADYNVEDATSEDASIIDEALSTIDDPDTSLYHTVKYSYDFDNDGDIEAIYNTTNYVFDIVYYDIYSLLYYVDDDSNIQMIDKIEDNPIEMEEILNLDNDNNYEIIISEGVLNLPTLDSCYKLYKLENNKWVEKKSCENN